MSARNPMLRIGLAGAAAALLMAPTGHGFLAEQMLDRRRPQMVRRVKPKPKGPTKKRAKVKAARKANLRRTKA